MEISNSPHFSLLRAVSLTFFLILLGATVKARASAPWDKLIEGLKEQKVLQQDQAQALKELMQESGTTPYEMEWSFKMQTQAALTDNRSSGDEQNYSTIELRRLRLGAKAAFGHNLSAEAEVHLVPGEVGLYEATMSWEPHHFFNLRAGYDKPQSSLDENTSSSKLITVERSHISKTVADPGESTGVMVDGQTDYFYYGFGVFTDQEGVNTEDQAPKYLWNGKLGLTWSELFGAASSLKLQTTVLHSKDHTGLLGEDFQKVRTLGFLLTYRAFQLQAEVLKGERGEGKIEGGYAMPSIRLGKHQAVLRLERADADRSGLSFPSRYSADAGLLTAADLGNLYRSAYLGWNYYLDPDIHKVMLGLEAAELSGTTLGVVKSNTLFLAWRMAI